MSYTITKTERVVPGGPVVGSPFFHCRGAQVQSLCQGIRSHIPCGTPSDLKTNKRIMRKNTGEKGLVEGLQ